MIPFLIVTRPAGPGREFSEAISSQIGDAVEIIQSPLIEIVELDITLPNADGLILTSTNGVMQAVRLNAGMGMPVWCVGERTAGHALNAGFDVKAFEHNGAALVKLMRKARPSGAIIHLRGKHTTGNISGALRNDGIRCDEVITYDQKALTLSETAQDATNGDRPVIFPLFSPRTATILGRAGPFKAPVHVVAISSAALPAIPAVSHYVAVRPDRDAMVDATFRCIESVSVA